jgi:hypothetical protein
MLSCLDFPFFPSADLNGLQSAGNECRALAEQTSMLSATARNKGQSVVDYTREVRDTLKNFGTKMDASTFVSIKALIENNKMTEAKTAASEMNDIAMECVNKSKAMAAAMQKGVKSLPDPVKDDLEDAKRDTDDEDVTEILDIHQDIQDLDNCTRDIKQMNLLSAARSGADAFLGLAEKQEACRNMFSKMKDLSASVVRLSEAFMEQNCCIRMRAMPSQANDMLKCIRLSGLITKIAEAVRTLIKAILRFLGAAWEKIKGFLDEFQAAKKIKTFVANKLESSKVGKRFQLGMDCVGNFFPDS